MRLFGSPVLHVIVKDEQAAWKSLMVRETETTRFCKEGKEWPSLAQEYGTDADLDCINQVGLQEGTKKLPATAKPNVLSALSAKSRYNCNAVVCNDRDFRVVGLLEGSREHVSAQPWISARAVAEHDFVRTTANEHGVYRSEEGFRVVARVTNHPRDAIANICDESVETHPDTVAYPAHFTSRHSLPNCNYTELVFVR
jgi:hypothetical protein